MNVLVYMKDGRTVFLLGKRSMLSMLVALQPEHEGRSVHAVRGIWNPHSGEYVWSRVMVRYLSKSSIAFVEQATGVADAVAMLKEEEREPELVA